MAWGDPQRLAEGTGSGQVTGRGSSVFPGEYMTPCAFMDWGLRPWDFAVKERTPQQGHSGAGGSASGPSDLELAIPSLHSSSHLVSSLGCCEDQMGWHLGRSLRT